MPVVKDITGKDWEFSIVLSSIARVKDIAKVDLLAVLSDVTQLQALGRDAVKCCEVLYALCVPKDSSITLDSFLDLWDGETLEAAFTVLLDGVADFFPKSRRDMLKNSLRLHREQAATILSKVGEVMEAEIGKETQKILDKITSASSNSVIGSQASSGQTPDLIH